jgi:hypothetical protein
VNEKYEQIICSAMLNGGKIILVDGKDLPGSSPVALYSETRCEKISNAQSAEFGLAS